MEVQPDDGDQAVGNEQRAKAQEFKNSGNEKFNKSNYKGAIVEYQKGLLHEPNNSDLHANLSAAYLHLEKYIEAEEHALFAIHLRPNFYKGYMRAAKADHGKGMTRLALKRLTQGLSNVDDPNGVKELSRLKNQYTAYLSLQSNSEREMEFDSDTYQSEDEEDEGLSTDDDSDDDEPLSYNRHPSPAQPAPPPPLPVLHNSGNSDISKPVPEESTDPTKEDPLSTDPTKEVSMSTDPTMEESMSTDPIKEEPMPTDPTKEESMSTDPTKEESMSTDPTMEESMSTDPTEEESMSTGPTKKESMSTDPTKEESISTDPTKEESIATDKKKLCKPSEPSKTVENKTDKLEPPIVAVEPKKSTDQQEESRKDPPYNKPEKKTGASFRQTKRIGSIFRNEEKHS